MVDPQEVHPANITEEERRSLLCNPPPGPFDFDCSHLRWTLRRSGKDKEPYHSAFIPADRYKDWEAGENSRGGKWLFILSERPSKGEKQRSRG